MAKIHPKRYIVWSTNKEIDLSDPWQRKWYIGEVLSNGRAEDIAELDWDEVRKLLPELNLPKRVGSLWEDYFKHTSGLRNDHAEISPRPSLPKRGIPPFGKGRKGGISP